MNDTTRELGGALGVAVLGSLVASRYDSQIVSASSRGLAGSAHADAPTPACPVRWRSAAQIGGAEGQRIADAAKDAYVSRHERSPRSSAPSSPPSASVIVYRKLPSTCDRLRRRRRRRGRRATPASSRRRPPRSIDEPADRPVRQYPRRP